MFMTFWLRNQIYGGNSWQQDFLYALDRNANSLGMSASDVGQYQIANAINAAVSPGTNTLQTVPITNFQSNGAGSYTISWNTPSSTDYVRVKWGPQQIVDWIGFDPTNGVFIGNPTTTQNWFASNEVTGVPAPVAGLQSMTIATGTTGLTAASFAVKAHTAGAVQAPPPPVTFNTVVLASGNNQSGTTGKTLALPLVVEVQDSNGNPVSGITVTFIVTVGGGTLSATQVATDSTGSASSVLSLGAAAGANTVTASASNVSGSPVTFTATATVPITGTPSVVWNLQEQTWNGGFTPGVPAFNQWLKIMYDPVSQEIFHYGIMYYSTSIYSTDVFFYGTAANSWSHVGGTGSPGNNCAASTASWPGDRHPMNQMALDTQRNRVWMWGGVCGGIDPWDMWYFQLGANPMTDTWQRVSPAHLPPYFIASAVYDSDDDVIVSFGNDGESTGHYTWVYCSTVGATPGVLSAKQAASGCTAADDWSEAQVVGGVMPTAGTNLPGLVYDTVNKKVILFGGYGPGPGAPASETWAYNVPTMTWVNRTPANGPVLMYSPSNTGVIGTPLTYNPNTAKTILQNPATVPETWSYDYPSNTWTLLCNTCSGPANPFTLAYDPSANALVALGYGGPGQLEVWRASFATQTSAPLNACDLNADGVVNSTDVQIAISQVVMGPCGNSDLIGNGVCSVIDVERVVNASLSGVCKTGQ
jgi:hypothetical protein